MSSRAFMRLATFGRPGARFISTTPSTRPITSITSATRIVRQQQQPQFHQHQHFTKYGRAYSTSASEQSLTPMARAMIATAHGVRNILIISTSGIALVYFIWAGTHSYLEQYKCPSPEGLSSTVRNCLHGAWVREEIAPDPDVADLYYQNALEFARKDLEEFYRKKAKNSYGIIDEEIFLEVEKDRALVEIQNRLARFYGRIGQDERAATIWTRLWKMSEKKTLRQDEDSGSTSSSTLGSFFGSSVERPLITKQDAIPFAKQAADCWMRLGEYDLAEEALGWILSSSSSTSSNTPTSIDHVGLISTLGALYVRKSDFTHALSLFVNALQQVQEHRAQLDGQDSQDNDLWYCREAILTGSIGEALYGAATASNSTPSAAKVLSKEESAEQSKSSSSWNFWSSSSSPKESTKESIKAAKTPEQIQKEQDALGWIQKAIALAQEKSGQHRDCDECAALGLNNLGLISEMEGNTELALKQFSEAILYASKAEDYFGLDEYKRNVTRVTNKIASASESTEPLSPPPPLPSITGSSK